MKVAVATDSSNVNALIPGELADAGYLFIVDVEKFEVLKVISSDQKINRDKYFAQQTVQEDCEAIICGEIEKEAFEILAKACVSRFLGTGITAGESIKLMMGYQLPLLRDYKGGPGCPGERSGDECHEHD